MLEKMESSSNSNGNNNICIDISPEWQHVPIIDISAFGDDHDGDAEGQKEQQETIAKELHEICKNVGFFYIKGHGCAPKVEHNAFSAVSNFFDMPSDKKMVLAAKNNPNHRGYANAETGGHSCTSKLKEQDSKETYTIGATKCKEEVNSPMHGPNQYPAEEDCPDFQSSMDDFYEQLLNTVAPRVMQALAMSLNLEKEYFVNLCDDPMIQMVLARYPPNKVDLVLSGSKRNNNGEVCELTKDRGQQGCGAHTDCGFLTILAQDHIAGLEVKRADGGWVSAPPIPGTLVVNLGDMVAQWTGDIYKSTFHRVYNTSSDECRHSIPFFAGTNFNALVAPISTLKGAKNFEPIKSGDYMLKKLGLMHQTAKK